MSLPIDKKAPHANFGKDQSNRLAYNPVAGRLTFAYVRYVYSILILYTDKKQLKKY